jgi:hypothetical protein
LYVGSIVTHKNWDVSLFFRMSDFKTGGFMLLTTESNHRILFTWWWYCGVYKAGNFLTSPKTINLWRALLQWVTTE